MAYIFAGYSFDRDSGLTYQSRPITLPPKERALLQFLLHAKGKTLSKDEVVRDVWQGGVVSDESISRAVYRLRLAMQSAGGPPVVTTVYNGGFRISAKIHERLREPGSSVAEWMLSKQAHRLLPMLVSGREFAARLSPQDLSNALTAANAAALIDPAYVPAWVAIAEFHVLQAMRGALAPKLAGQLALAAAHKALELDGDCGPALAVSGWVSAILEGELLRGRELVDNAYRQDSEYWNTCMLRAAVLQAAGAQNDAVEMAQQAYSLNPHSLFVAAALPMYLMYAGQLLQAISSASDMAQRFPDLDGAQETLAILLGVQGELEPALMHARRAAELAPHSPWLHAQHAYLLARLQRGDEARLALDTMCVTGRPRPHVALALVHWGLGEKALALECLREARLRGSPQFFPVRDDLRWAALAADEEFAALWSGALRPE